MDKTLKPSPLTQMEEVPTGLLETSVEELYTILPGPALIHLPGTLDSPLFVSVLLHGNESTGFLAIQALLRKYENRQLPRSVSIFFGNIAAAKLGVRRLENQLDYNRIWPGTEYPESEDSLMTREVVDLMAKRNVSLSIDIHNNTGINPHYACVNKLDHRFLQIATLFSRLVVYFIRPKGVLSAAFANLCPSVTLECGKPEHHYGVEHALDFLEGCLRLKNIPNHPVPKNNIDLFHTVAQITIRDYVSFGFRGNNADFILIDDLDHMNFTEKPAGTVFGELNNTSDLPVSAVNETGKDVTEKYFSISGNRLIIKKSIMPSMLTQDIKIIRQDCLCYLMERISL